MATLNPAIGTSAFESRIRVIRGLWVMLDVDLAALYGVPTKRLNEQVKRNRDRFPSDFLFQLTADEKSEVVANCDHLQYLKSSRAFPLRLPSWVPPKRPIRFLTHEGKKTPKASALTKGRKAP